jgi:hypothetical protein
MSISFSCVIGCAPGAWGTVPKIECSDGISGSESVSGSLSESISKCRPIAIATATPIPIPTAETARAFSCVTGCATGAREGLPRKGQNRAGFACGSCGIKFSIEQDIHAGSRPGFFDAPQVAESPRESPRPAEQALPSGRFRRFPAMSERMREDVASRFLSSCAAERRGIACLYTSSG